VPQADCPNCGGKLPAKSRFCPECGVRVGGPGETAVQEVPPTEPAPAPARPFVAERRFFGVPPSTVIFGIGVAALTLSILFFAIGQWPWGLLLLGVAVFVLAGFVAQTRRLPAEASGVAKASLAALDSVRARAEAAVETVAAHGTARIELVGLRRDVVGLAAARSDRLRELGEVVYEGNRAATKDLKKQVKELDDLIQAKEDEMSNVATKARERIGRAQLQVQSTRILSEESEPAPVPEPFPPPDEGQPPEPARLPEPFPPPDEGERPEQPTIPEPGPVGQGQK